MRELPRTRDHTELLESFRAKFVEAAEANEQSSQEKNSQEKATMEPNLVGVSENRNEVFIRFAVCLVVFKS